MEPLCSRPLIGGSAIDGMLWWAGRHPARLITNENDLCECTISYLWLNIIIFHGFFVILFAATNYYIVEFLLIGFDSLLCPGEVALTTKRIGHPMGLTMYKFVI